MHCCQICFYYLYLLLLLLKYSTPIPISLTSRIYLSSFQTFPLQHNTCIEIIIPNNYKKINLTTTSTDSTSSFLLTDIQLPSKLNITLNNMFTLSDYCQHNATFCIEDTNTKSVFYTLNYCLENTFLYVCTTNNTDSFISLETTVIKGEGCQIAEYLEETECSNMGIQSCQDDSTCSKSCQYAECFNSEDKKILSLCLPVNFTLNDIVMRCDNHLEFNENGKGGKVKIKQCINEIGGGYKKEESFGKKFFKFILVCLGMGLLSLLMSSVYYRFKTSMDVNRPPFNPPWFCPNFIYPRVNPNLF